MTNTRRPLRGHARVTRQHALVTLKLQALATVLIASAALLYSTVAAYSALLGGVLYLIPQSFFTWRTFRENNNRAVSSSAQAALADMYIGQIWKMGIAALGFALVFSKIDPVSPFPIFGSYVALHALGAWLQLRANTGS